MSKVKMNVMLARNENASSQYTSMLGNYKSFFKSSQGAFMGEKKTYQAREGYNDEPSMVGNTVVQTTVDEKIEWLEKESASYLKDLFAIEATNSKGANRVELVVDGRSFGELSALELMRLKTILTRPELVQMYEIIPVRSDSEVWTPTSNKEYEGREIYETALEKGVKRTTEKEEVILRDPNIDSAHIPANYRATVTTKSKTVEVGDYTRQKFSGQWTQREKAELLRRRSEILKAVIEALKVVNDIETEDSNLDVNGMLHYLHYGK